MDNKIMLHKLNAMQPLNLHTKVYNNNWKYIMKTGGLRMLYRTISCR